MRVVKAPSLKRETVAGYFSFESVFIDFTYEQKLCFHCFWTCYNQEMEGQLKESDQFQDIDSSSMCIQYTYRINL